MVKTENCYNSWYLLVIINDPHLAAIPDLPIPCPPSISSGASDSWPPPTGSWPRSEANGVDERSRPVIIVSSCWRAAHTHETTTNNKN